MSIQVKPINELYKQWSNGQEDEVFSYLAILPNALTVMVEQAALLDYIANAEGEHGVLRYRSLLSLWAAKRQRGLV